jgi:hypothetical protein
MTPEDEEFEAIAKRQANMKYHEQLAAEMQNEEMALELQGLVKEFFEKYLNRVEKRG